MNLLFEQLELAPATAFASLLAFARVFTVVLIVPFLGGRLVPLAAKVGISMALVAVVAPTLAPSQAILHLTSLEVLALLVKETALGAVIGVLTALVFYGAAMAGAIIQGAQTGDPSAESSPPTTARSLGYSDLYLMVTVVLFLALGGHRLFVRSLHRSFQLLPSHELPTGLVDPGQLALLTGNLFLIAVAIALPILVALLVVDLGFAAFGRAVHRIHSAALGLPIKVLVAVLVVAASMAAALDLLMGGAAHMDSSLRHLLEQMGHGG